jgi:hypothetical protein
MSEEELEQITKKKLELLRSRIEEAMIEWRPDEAIEQIQSFQMAIASALEKSKS